MVCLFTFKLIDAGYLACARCSNTGALVLIEPLATVSGGDQPLSPPKTERCSNCSGSGKVRLLKTAFLNLISVHHFGAIYSIWTGDYMCLLATAT